MPRYLVAHASLGAAVGALLAAAILGADLPGLRPLVARDPVALVMVPAFMSLFAVAAAATAIALLGAQGEQGLPLRGLRARTRHLVARRLAVRR